MKPMMAPSLIAEVRSRLLTDIDEKDFTPTGLQFHLLALAALDQAQRYSTLAFYSSRTEKKTLETTQWLERAKALAVEVVEKTKSGEVETVGKALLGIIEDLSNTAVKEEA